MEEDLKKTQDWYIEYKEKQLEKDIKRCNAFAVASGVVASLSALVVAGNIVVGNGLEVLQVGGSTAAMFGYLLTYTQMGNIYKKEQKDFPERTKNPQGFVKDRLAVLRHQLELVKTQLSMDYLVAGSFYATTLGHVIELLTIPDAPQMVSNITGAALSALVATLYLKISKTHRINAKVKASEIEGLEAIEELEEEAKKPIPELIEREEVLELTAPQEEPVEQQILQLENIPKKK